jgi:hypothetical protein
VPKAVIKDAKVTSEQFIIREENIPITIAQVDQEAPENIRRELKSREGTLIKESLCSPPQEQTHW